MTIPCSGAMGADVAHAGGEDDSPECLKPRQFQEELLEITKHMNTIVYLETGSGKTHIAVMLLKEKRHQIVGTFSSGAKRSVFLAISNFLVEQQKRYLERFMPTGITVRTFVGNQGVEFWDQRKWLEELENCHVLVMTPAVLFDAMASNYINPTWLNLLIFDECHEAVGKAFYAKIMGEVNKKVVQQSDRPLILGLTATIVNDSAPSCLKAARALQNLELTYHAAVVGPRQAPGSHEYATCAVEIFEVYPDQDLFDVVHGVSKAFLSKVQEAQKSAEQCSLEAERRITNLFKTNMRLRGDVEVSTFNPFEDMKRIFMEWEEIAKSLGVLASLAYGKSIAAGMQTAANAVIADRERFDYLLGLVAKLTKIAELDFKALGSSFEQRVRQCITPKVDKLLEILSDYYKEDNQTMDDVDLSASGDSSDDESDSRYLADGHEIMRHHRRAIIFVERRATAEGLKCLLEEYAKATKELSEMEVAAVHGAQAPRNVYKKGGSIMTAAEKREHLLMTESKFEDWQGEIRKQLEHLDRFRMGELNLLVSTNVLEQGIDVPACNLVIRFDVTKDFKSYVQSRGRARSKPARFIFFVASSKAAEVKSKVRGWKTVEKELVNICANRIVPSQADVDKHIQKTQALPSFAPFGPTGPSIDPVQAVAKVYKYIGRYGVWYRPIFSCECFGGGVASSTMTNSQAVSAGYRGPEISFEPRDMRIVHQVADDPLFAMTAAADDGNANTKSPPHQQLRAAQAEA